MYSILVVDDNELICLMLNDFLEERYNVDTAYNSEEAKLLLEKKSYNMVIADINMPGENGPELLSGIKKRFPEIKTILITAYNIDDYLTAALEYEISNIIPKTTPFNYNLFDSMVKGLLTENIFGLEIYLNSGAVIDKKYCVKSSAEGRKTREELAAHIKKHYNKHENIKLILDEIITNAIYHAPLNSDGTQKYVDYYPVELDASEYVDVCLGYDSEKYGISIVDNSGTLKKKTILYKLARHTKGEGIFDCSGRGIHMSRLFADNLIINVKQGYKTEVIIINYYNRAYQGSRPLYINEI